MQKGKQRKFSFMKKTTQDKMIVILIKNCSNVLDEKDRLDFKIRLPSNSRKDVAAESTCRQSI